jgi:hypothetical protein
MRPTPLTSRFRSLYLFARAAPRRAHIFALSPSPVSPEQWRKAARVRAYIREGLTLQGSCPADGEELPSPPWNSFARFPLRRPTSGAAGGGSRVEEVRLMVAGNGLRADDWDDSKPRNKRRYDKDPRERSRRDGDGRMHRLPKRARNEDDDVSDYDDDYENDNDDFDLDEDDDFELDDEDDFDLDDEDDDWDDDDDDD